MSKNREMKIADDHCPTCDNPVEVYAPQPYASGPEMEQALEAILSLARTALAKVKE